MAQGDDAMTRTTPVTDEELMDCYQHSGPRSGVYHRTISPTIWVQVQREGSEYVAKFGQLANVATGATEDEALAKLSSIVEQHYSVVRP